MASVTSDNNRGALKKADVSLLFILKKANEVDARHPTACPQEDKTEQV